MVQKGVPHNRARTSSSTSPERVLGRMSGSMFARITDRLSLQTIGLHWESSRTRRSSSLPSVRRGFEIIVPRDHSGLRTRLRVATLNFCTFLLTKRTLPDHITPRPSASGRPKPGVTSAISALRAVISKMGVVLIPKNAIPNNKVRINRVIRFEFGQASGDSPVVPISLLSRHIKGNLGREINVGIMGIGR